jgi:hypothetical protein
MESKDTSVVSASGPVEKIQHLMVIQMNVNSQNTFILQINTNAYRLFEPLPPLLQSGKGHQLHVIHYRSSFHMRWNKKPVVRWSFLEKKHAKLISL